MAKALDKLIGIAGESLSSAVSPSAVDFLKHASLLKYELFELLTRKNGFYAFESALHVFPTHTNGNEMGLVDWNDHQLWCGEYQHMVHDCLFFAEDVFGGQFCIKVDGVYLFDPETGSLEFFSDNLEQWAHALLRDYEVLTGYPLAHAWQKINGPLGAGYRLIPKIPFVTGGEFSAENLVAVESVKGMRMRANLAEQIRSLPDGTTISWKVVD